MRNPTKHDRTQGAAMTAKSTTVNESLDLTTVLEISQQISTELHASNVVRKVLTGIAQNAGAERALLIMRDASGVERVYAELASGAYRQLGVPLSEYDQLPESMLRVVRRTKQPLVAADAVNEAGYKHDPFIVAGQCRSVACVPVLRKGELSGFVVLENRLVAGAFTQQLLNLTRALIAQAAISLDNASLYEDMEERVRERTLALNERNAKMRVVLDNVSQGLVVVDREGALSSERSAILDRWFPEGLPSHVAGFFEHAPKVWESFQANWQQLLEGFLPLELCADQLPRELAHDGKLFEFAWQPLSDARGELRSVLVVLSDVTELRRREQAEQFQKQLMVIFEKILADQHAVSAFVHETDQLLAEIESGVERADVEKRLLHTLKGTTAIFGLTDFSSQCHTCETALESEQRRMRPEERAQLARLWRETRAGFERFLNAQSHGLQVPIENYEAALERLQRDRHSLAGDLALWKLESARSRFERIAEQAQKLAVSLEKAPISVDIEDGRVYFVDDVWTPFWSAFIHVVRNALDHGIESPDERARVGKGPGSLRLRAYLTAEAFVFEVADDGRGIAWERLREKARAAGLPSETHDHLLSALFADGVSTKDAVDELSGRGVGLAALRAVCDEMQAQIEVSSTQGEGTTWRFVFPPALVRAPRSVAKRLRPSLSA
jgi:HPt (histidine-containing phosphotransfer) domain-containing protein